MPTPAEPTNARHDRVVTRGNESPPLSLGPKRLHYQFSAALPQVHLTFVSIVQGIAFGVLFQDLPVPERGDIAHLGAFLLAQHVYLPWIISGLLIVIIWKQFVQASLLALWPLSAGQIVLMLLIAVAETTAFREIRHLSAWIVGFGLVAIVGGCIRINNLRLLKGFEYESAKARQGDIASEIVSGLTYIALGVGIMLCGVARFYTATMPQIHLFLSWGALALLLCIVIGVLIIDHRRIRQLISYSLEGSDLEYVAPGSLRYHSESTLQAVALAERSKAHDD